MSDCEIRPLFNTWRKNWPFRYMSLRSYVFPETRLPPLLYSLASPLLDDDRKQDWWGSLVESWFGNRIHLLKIRLTGSGQDPQSPYARRHYCRVLIMIRNNQKCRLIEYSIYHQLQVSPWVKRSRHSVLRATICLLVLCSVLWDKHMLSNFAISGPHSTDCLWSTKFLATSVPWTRWWVEDWAQLAWSGQKGWEHRSVAYLGALLP